MIIEICPKCGHDIVSSYVATFPPLPMKYCTFCDWHWEGEPEEIVRVPFGENNSDYFTKTNLYDVKTNNEILNNGD